MLSQLQAPLKSAGDTIVEVLVVLAIVGLALSISFVTANHSLRTVRNSQEHAQALQLIQGQLEQLRATLADVTAEASVNGQINTKFCFVSGAVVPATDPGCNTLDGLYDVSLQCKVFAAGVCTDHIYTAEAVWDSITGPGKDTVSLVYRVYGA